MTHDMMVSPRILAYMDRPRVVTSHVAGDTAKKGRVMQVLDAFKRSVKASGEDHALRWRLFGVERYLDRFQQVVGEGKLVVKGGVLLRTLLPANLRRSTKDIDLAADGLTQSDIHRYAIEACAVDCGDGCTYDPASVRTGPIIGARASGVRVTARGKCGSSVLEAQCDIGFGDVWSPGAQRILMPSMVDIMPGVAVAAYHPATIVAEKYHAMVDKGLENSRMKDFFDIAAIADHLNINGDHLVAAITDTFANRRAAIPVEMPVCFSKAFTHGTAQTLSLIHI